MFEDFIDDFCEELDITEDDIKEEGRDYRDYGYVIILEDGREYNVYDKEGRLKAFADSTESLFDDVGLEGFGNAKTVLISCADEEWFEDFFREDYDCYARDIASEDDDEFDNRLTRELYEKGIIDDEDFEQEEDEDGEEVPDYKNPTYDEDEAIEKFVEAMVDDIFDFIEEYEFQFGKESLTKVINEYGLIDFEKAADILINRWDLAGNELAYYDGIEIDLDDGYYAYRVN